MNEGVSYGYGLFETIRFQNGKVQNAKRHYGRLTKSTCALDIPFDMSFETFEESLKDLARNSKIDSGAIRFQVSKRDTAYETYIDVRENRYKKEAYAKGFRLSIAETLKASTSILVHHKSVNYMENLLVLRNAKTEGFDEALFLNEKRYITEGTYTNVFFIKDDTVYTPALSCGLLEGTMRDQVIEALDKVQIEVKEGAYTLDDIKHAQSVFLTNALMGVMPVREIDRVGMYNMKHEFLEYLSGTVMANWFD